jgi:hypothetical protein
MRWLSPQEVANLTGRSANQVMKAIKHGAIAASYNPQPRGKGRWWIAEAEAERYQATLKASAA